MHAGAIAPDFELRDHEGTPRRLYAMLRDGPVVLSFYPAASSPICTAQACRLRDLAAEFASVGAQRVGISTDTVDKLRHFVLQRSFDFPVLSDPGAAVSAEYGVRRRMPRLERRRLRRELIGGRRRRASRRESVVAKILNTKRTTFVIDTDGVVLRRIHSSWPRVHADHALECLQFRA